MKAKIRNFLSEMEYNSEFSSTIVKNHVIIKVIKYNFLLLRKEKYKKKKMLKNQLIITTETL
jgi:hypothetical protein